MPYESLILTSAPVICRYDPNKPSKAVVANGGQTGIIIWHVGYNLFFATKDDCLLSEIGIDDTAPEGISIWEEDKGRVFIDGLYDGFEYSLSGEFRDPTEVEWKMIKRGVAPWVKENWELPICGLINNKGLICLNNQDPHPDSEGLCSFHKGVIK